MNNKKNDLIISEEKRDNNKMSLKKQHSFGQYFTKNIELKNKIYEFILNKPDIILEPSIGRGDLVDYVINNNPKIIFDMYEIDKDIEVLDKIKKGEVIYGDFLEKVINKKYKTIIGNPPYVKTKRGNLYIDFIEKCYNLLEDNGELIFIIPSDFFKLTSACKILNKMMENGTFTHIYHPNNEKLFENASIDIIIFRYYKNSIVEKRVLYNDKNLYIINSNGLITFNKTKQENCYAFKEYFDIYVGIVSGKDGIYKHKELGNIDVLNGKNKIDKYIFIDKYPSDNKEINKYLLEHKNELLKRKIRKFNDKNWFEWGAPRNIRSIKSNIEKECIYIYNLTRKSEIAFIGKVDYFGGGLIMLIPKVKCDLKKIVSYLNTDVFKNNFIFSGRFKIGHRQISNSYIPEGIL
jgi:adenine-specific DNA-methyltransferase